MNANVEDRGIKGDCTPLMEAASGGFVDIVRLLILHGADVNAQSSAGKIYVALIFWMVKNQQVSFASFEYFKCTEIKISFWFSSLLVF